MATRLYMTNVAAPYTPTTKRGAWDKNTQTLARHLGPRPSGAATTVNVTPGATTANWDVLWGRWISDPAIAAGTLSGTMSWILGVLEANAAVNGFFHIHAFVTAGDSDTVRDTLLTDSIGATEFTTTATARGEGAKALTSVAVSVGDRICIEVGYRSTSDLTTRSVTMNYGNTGTTDATQGSTSVTTQPGWFEFSAADGLFYTPISTVIDDFDDGTLDNPPWSANYGPSGNLPSVVSGELNLPAISSGGSPQYAGAQADPPAQGYELDSVYAKLTAVPSSIGATSEAYTDMIVFNTGVAGTYAGWVYDAVAAKLCALNAVSYTDVTTRVELTYSGPIWVRLRRSGANLLWETSPDASTWTTQRTETAPAWTNYHNLGLLLEAARDGGTDDYARWDSLNTSVSPSIISLTPATMTLDGQAVTGVPGAVTVSLTPAAMTLAGVSVTGVPQAVQVSLTPASITASGVVLTPVTQPVQVSLTSAGMTLAGVGLTGVPQPVGVSLTPAVVVLSGVVISAIPQLVQASLTPVVLSLTGVVVLAVPSPVIVSLTPAVMTVAGTPVTAVPGVITVNLTPATAVLASGSVWPRAAVFLTAAAMIFTGPQVTPIPQPITVTLVPAVAVLESNPVTPIPGPVSVSLSPCTVSVGAVPLDVVVQAGTMALTPATVAIDAVPVTGVAGQVLVTLVPAALSFTPVALGGGGAGIATLTPVVLSVTAQPVSGTPGLVSASLTPVALVLAAQAVDPTPQPVVVSLTPAGVEITAPMVTLVLGAVTVALTPAGLALTAETLVAVGPAEVTLVAVTVTFVAVPGGIVSLIARPASFSVVLSRDTAQATLARDTAYVMMDRPTVRAQI